MVREALTPQRLGAMPADEAAAYWLARKTEGLTLQEQELLEDWLSWDSRYGEALGEAERVLETIRAAPDDELVEAMRLHALAATAAPARSWRIQRWAAAAAMIPLVIAGTLLFVPGNPSPPGDEQQQVGGPQSALVYASAKGEVKAITLPDGSRLTLDTATVARASFGGDERKVQLVRGRAFFEVRQDGRPFSVLARNLRVVAIGTKFDVALDAEKLEVRLLEGKVAIGSPGSDAKPVVLRPSQAFTERGGKTVIRPVDHLADELMWRQGFAYFSEDSLRDAVAEINRYSDEQIVVRDPGVAALRVSGQFRAGDPERFAHMVERIHPVRMVRRGPHKIEIVAAR